MTDDLRSSSSWDAIEGAPADGGEPQSELDQGALEQASAESTVESEGMGEVVEPTEPDYDDPATHPDDAPADDASQLIETPETAVETSNSDDRLMGALAWATTALFQLPLVPIVLLLAEGNKNRPFQRHHAITSLLFWGVSVAYEVVAAILFTILTLISAGCLGLFLWVLFFLPHLAMLFYAYQAYTGKTVEIPVVSSFARGQGWQ